MAAQGDRAPHRLRIFLDASLDRVRIGLGGRGLGLFARNIARRRIVRRISGAGKEQREGQQSSAHHCPFIGIGLPFTMT